MLESIIKIIMIIMSILNRPDEKLLTISIPKINIKQEVYKQDSILNDIDKNVIILEESDLPDKNLGTVLIGAHSGTGEIAYFKNLDKIIKGDIIKIEYKNKNYNYSVTNIYLDNKDGSISINYNSNVNRLILYTCNPADKDNFLIIESKKI